MARRRKQTNDPRQLSLFDVMANQIEEIRAENIQDDMREEGLPEVVPLQRKNKRFLRSRNSIRSFPFRQTTSRKERSSASTATANPCMKCATVRVCTVAILKSCSSLTVKRERPKSCLRPERTSI